MEPSARIIADSIYNGVRLTTMEVTFHRFVLAEFNTHRAFSRNSASSRAIPVEKQLLRAINEPAFPLSWPCEQPGMQGGSQLTGDALEDAEELIYGIYEDTLTRIDKYIEAHPDKATRLHKGHLNRPMEWFMYHTAIVTSTDFDNFFAQRCHEAAQPEIAAVAWAMQRAYYKSVPYGLARGQWHTPYIDLSGQDEELSLRGRLAVSAARCARVSYLSQDGVRDIEADIRLFERLTTSKPGHWSPLEHVAMAGGSSALRGNLATGWAQLRHYYEGDGNPVPVR